MKNFTVLSKSEMKQVNGGNVMSPEATYDWCLLQGEIQANNEPDPNVSSIILSVSQNMCWQAYLEMSGGNP